MQDALQTLGLRAGGFNQETLKKAFQRESLRIHPDRGGTDQDFRQLVKHYKVLKEFLKSSVPPPLHNESKESLITDLPKIGKGSNKMDPITFNRVFATTHNTETNGHGEWLSTAPTDAQARISFKNFNKAFQKKAQKQSMSLIARSTPIIPASGCSLSPTMTTDESKRGNVDFSSPPRTGRMNTLAYSDLKVTHDQQLIDPLQAEKFASIKQPLLQSLLEETLR